MGMDGMPLSFPCFRVGGCLREGVARWHGCQRNSCTDGTARTWVLASVGRTPPFIVTFSDAAMIKLGDA
jgi:hypothetical protein